MNKIIASTFKNVAQLYQFAVVNKHGKGFFETEAEAQQAVQQLTKIGVKAKIITRAQVAAWEASMAAAAGI